MLKKAKHSLASTWTCLLLFSSDSHQRRRQWPTNSTVRISFHKPLTAPDFSSNLQHTNKVITSSSLEFVQCKDPSKSRSSQPLHFTPIKFKFHKPTRRQKHRTRVWTAACRTVTTAPQTSLPNIQLTNSLKLLKKHNTYYQPFQLALFATSIAVKDITPKCPIISC